MSEINVPHPVMFKALVTASHGKISRFGDPIYVNKRGELSNDPAGHVVCYSTEELPSATTAAIEMFVLKDESRSLTPSSS